MRCPLLWRPLVRCLGVRGVLWVVPTAVAVGVPTSARAGAEAFRVSEVSASAGGQATVRFVELHAPAQASDPCFFPTSRIEIFRADGTLIGDVKPVVTTTCFGGETYFLFATPQAASHYGVVADAPLPYALPADGGQICYRSTDTRYDCVRWGVVTNAVPDFENPGDTSSADALQDGSALARRSASGVVADDFVLAVPTPRQPNDGTVWIPPDGGPDAPAPSVDSGPGWVDANLGPDARPPTSADAADRPPAWFSADPGGGVACECRVGVAAEGRPGPGLGMGVLVAVGLGWMRRRRI